MGSKTILLLGLSFAIVLLICSEVAARDLVEQTSTEAVKETNGVEEAKYDQSYGGYPGGGYGGHGGYGGRGGYNGGGHGGGYGGGHGGGHGGGGCRYRCRYGCCRYGCCKAADAQTQVKPQN